MSNKPDSSRENFSGDTSPEEFSDGEPELSSGASAGPSATQPADYAASAKIEGGLWGNFLHMFKALRYSSQGLAAGWRLSLAFRQEVLLAGVLVALLTFFGKQPGQWLLVLGGWSLVMVAELVNTAIEEALDLITKDFSVKVRDAKDMASAAVFLLVLVNGGIFLHVFLRDILGLFLG